MRKVFDWFILFLFLGSIVVFIGWTINKNMPTLEPGDDVVTCIIDSAYIKKPQSVADYKPVYVYHTNCGHNLYTEHEAYKKGDTITYIYKHMKK